MKKIEMKPWDFALYAAEDDTLVLQVVFSEGAYKIDIDRYFQVGSLIGCGAPLDALEELAAYIRSNYPRVDFPQVDRSNLTFANQ